MGRKSRGGSAASRQRYAQSPKGKATLRRYKQSAKGQLTQQRARARYRQRQALPVDGPGA